MRRWRNLSERPPDAGKTKMTTDREGGESAPKEERACPQRKTAIGGSFGWHFKKRPSIYAKIWPYRTIDQIPITKEELHCLR
jgi:hypothetical protein